MSAGLLPQSRKHGASDVEKAEDILAILRLELFRTALFN
jgi:hypothetical protein